MGLSTANCEDSRSSRTGLNFVHVNKLVSRLVSSWLVAGLFLLLAAAKNDSALTDIKRPEVQMNTNSQHVPLPGMDSGEAVAIDVPTRNNFNFSGETPIPEEITAGLPKRIPIVIQRTIKV